MTNINPATPQRDFSNSPQPAINNSGDSQSTGSKLWMVLVILLAMIVGFWIGYLTNDYFYQSVRNQENLMNQMNEQDLEPVVDLEEDLMIVEDQFIIFNGEEIYLNETISFLSEEQCVDDETMVLIAINEDSITLQRDMVDPIEDTEEFVEETLDLQIRDQDCVELTQEICPDVRIERCFSLTNIDGVHHLDYGFGEEGVMPLPDSEM
jgi:hypothetical protein